MLALSTSKENYRVLGILIRSERINKGYSLRELGELANISHTLISNIETGKQTPTPETLSDIFHVLDLNFHNELKYSNIMKKSSKEIYSLLFNQEYDAALPLIKELEKDEQIYLYSAEVVNYMILKCLFYTITNTYIDSIESTIAHYQRVVEFFSDTQRQLFYFIKGLNHLNNERYNKATEVFNEALEFGDKDLDVYIKEYNIISLVRQYKFIDAYRDSVEVIKEFEDRTIYIRAMKTKLQVARILFHIAKNDETEKIVAYVYRFAKKYNVDELLEDCAVLRAAISIRNLDFEKAEEYINEIPDSKSVAAVLLKFKIAFVNSDLEHMEEYYNEISKYDSVKKHEKVWVYLQIQAMSKLESLYNKEEYFKKIKRLIEISSANNDQEIIGIAHNYLIMFYHEERSYKKALDIAEKLLHIKKIRLEDKKRR